MEQQMQNADRSKAALRLIVRNHAGVMSHVCGLFARRAFNLEAILCLPIGDAERSMMLLSVNEDARLEQLTRQLRKLEDVLEIEPCSTDAFAGIAAYLQSSSSGSTPLTAGSADGKARLGR